MNDALNSISASSLTPALSTLVQRLLLMLIGYFGLTGYIDNDEVTKITAGIVGLALAGWGSYRSYRANEAKKKLAVAPSVPDSAVPGAVK